jgi:hypothetical protein
MKREAIYEEDGRRYRIRCDARLSQLRGNPRPYFSVTGEIKVAEGGYWREHSGGCLHEPILKHWPDLAPLVALHLSDDTGAPMHAEAKGWYDLAGCYEHGMGQQYHAGNAEYRKRLPIELFADHCRISLVEAQSIVDECAAELGPINEAQDREPYGMDDYKRARAKWVVIMGGMRPRWQREAELAIAQFGLEVEHA